MSAWKQFGLLILFGVANHVRGALAPNANLEEEVGRKLTAHEDAAALLKEMNSVDGNYGLDWIVMPDGDGLPQIGSMKEPKGSQIGKLFGGWSMEDVRKHVYFLLHTEEYPEGIRFTRENLTGIPFSPEKPTKIICHGWRSTASDKSMTSIKDTYLKSKDVNVIGVDWGFIAGDPIYPNAAGATRLVGEYLAEHMNALVSEFHADRSDFHIIGHSLGAHVAGFAGAYTNRKIDRITGLDPALPGFQYVAGPDARLDASDAHFVDVIHTCSGILGVSVPVGHVDFYPNGGSPCQPGCLSGRLLGGPQSCSHSRAYEYFSESIESSDFIGVRCEDWDHFKGGRCNQTFAVMGERVPQGTTGIYYLVTHPTAPFAMGREGVNY